MDRETEKYIIEARLRDITSDINLIKITLDVAEFAEHQQDWLDKERIQLTKLKEEQKTLKEGLYV